MRTTTGIAGSQVVERCRHCGNPCDAGQVINDAGTFCCHGCASVYQLLEAHGLGEFYALDDAPGVSQQRHGSDRQRFAALDDAAVAQRLIEFQNDERAIATLSLPEIHCASCVWLLEQLWRFDAGVYRAEVDLLRRTVRVEFDPRGTTLRAIAEQLTALGYEPALESEATPHAIPAGRRRLYLQLGVAGFAFGNIMAFSLPRYFNGGPIDPMLQRTFDVLNIVLSVPVLTFSASDYLRAAWNAVRGRRITLEVPVAIGLMVLFVRSVADIADGQSAGYLDSFSGLVFFLLIGRLFQSRAFDAIAFDRTYRSFFPLSVRVERHGQLEIRSIDQVVPGDVVVVRPGEIVPADSQCLDERGALDYAFITGEDALVGVAFGDPVRAGGRAALSTLRVQVVREVSHSQLARLWNNPLFGRAKTSWLLTMAGQFGLWFLIGAMALAVGGAIAWLPDTRMAATVATAVLIIACPCALTLAAPITLGTAMGLLGRYGLYLKQPAVVLDLSRIDRVLFDKTGTLTTGRGLHVDALHGLDAETWMRVRRLAAASMHPASRALAASGPAAGVVEAVQELPGLGITGRVDGLVIAIGASGFVANATGCASDLPGDRTFVGVRPDRLGWVRFSSSPRETIEETVAVLAEDRDLWLVSGDNDREASQWRPFFRNSMWFRQSAAAKLALVERAQADGHHVLMVGDGLNDAGALKAADVGLAVSDDTACIVPSCDAVIAGDRLDRLPAFLRYASHARVVIWTCLALSMLYNVFAVGLALRGDLTPLASAILMPASSLAVIGLSAGAMRWSARRVLS